MEKQKVKLFNAETGQQHEATEEELADLLGVSPDEPDYEPLMRGFFGFLESSDDA